MQSPRRDVDSNPGPQKCQEQRTAQSGRSIHYTINPLILLNVLHSVVVHVIQEFFLQTQNIFVKLVLRVKSFIELTLFREKKYLDQIKLLFSRSLKNVIIIQTSNNSLGPSQTNLSQSLTVSYEKNYFNTCSLH